MMNNRVLELLKNPKNIQSEDLHLLKEEINSFPYIQNIRALHLYGVHLFDKENYQKELSTTAAYTTDKKILYQLINGKIEQVKAEKPVENNTLPEPENKNVTVQNSADFSTVEEEKKLPKHDYEAVSGFLITPRPEIKQIFVNGERNRILFEGEENFLDEDNSEKIDLESTLESGVIVMHKAITPENQSETNDFESSESVNLETIIHEDKIDSEKVAEKINDETELSFQKIESFEPSETETSQESSVETENQSETTDFESSESLNVETIIHEDKIDSEKVEEKVNDESELSFHGTDSFLPEIKIEAKNTDQEIQPEAAKPRINKHEDEMRRLIEEVEKKMKAQKKDSEPKTEIQEEAVGGEISFAETQDFVVGNAVENNSEEKQAVEKENTENIQQNQEGFKNEENETAVSENVSQENSGWKPMNFEAHLPDSYSKKSEIQTESGEIESPENNVSEKSEIVEEIQAEKSENINEEETADTEEAMSDSENDEVPVMNVSFFGTDISSLQVRNEEKEQPKGEEENIKLQNQTPLDSNVPGFINTWQNWLKIDRSEEIEKAKAQNKNKVIESFIENNPKISQLKDEVNFVVKEKTDDISHLMTETLANLYIEQKLYTKAINAFRILANKHPERKEYFENKIQEIKDNRGKN